MLKIIVLCLFCMLVSAGPALAIHPLVTDDTGTQGKGRLQFELNGETGWDREGEIKVTAAEMAAAFSIGLTDTVDFVIGVPWQWNREQVDGVTAIDTNGLGDTTIELKWRFFETGEFSMAAKPEVIFPSGSEERGLGNGKVSYGATLIATQVLQPFTFHANAAYTRNEFRVLEGPNTNRHDIYHLSVAGQYEVVENLQLLANIGFESNSSIESRTWPAFILGGFIFTPVENLDFDLGVKGGLNKVENDLAVMAGVTVRF